MLTLAGQLISRCAIVRIATEGLRFWFAVFSLVSYLQCFGVAIVFHVQIPIGVLLQNVITRDSLDEYQQQSCKFLFKVTQRLT